MIAAMADPAQIRRHSTIVKSLTAEYFASGRMHSMPADELLAIRTTVVRSLRFLDPLVRKAPRSRAVSLLGKPYGEWGRDSLLYPGPASNQFYRVDLVDGVVRRTGFVTILDAEYGK